eukprot:6525157-Ditylum_brightwellii.AAC.1
MAINPLGPEGNEHYDDNSSMYTEIDGRERVMYYEISDDSVSVSDDDDDGVDVEILEYNGDGGNGASLEQNSDAVNDKSFKCNDELKILQKQRCR